MEESSIIKIGLVQMFCEKADIDNNLRRHNDYIVEAESKGVDILAFPEASITGYVDRNLEKYPDAIIPPDGATINAVCSMTEGRNMTVLTGFIEENHGGKPFVTQAVIRDGNITGCYRKMNIVDEDNDWFTPGDSVSIFTHDGISFGLAICSDLANEEIFAEYARRGAKIVFLLAAPGLLGEQATRNWQAGYEWWEGECRKHLEGYAQKNNLWIAVATQAGRTVNEDFPGGGYVFAPDGMRVFATKNWDPCAIYPDIDTKNNLITEI